MELDFSMAASLLIAVFLGFSIGLQREISFYHREKNIIFTGARSFAIISLLGVLASYFKAQYISITIVITAIFGLMLIGSYVVRALHHKNSGTTTEFAAIAAFVVGMLVYDRLYIYATFSTVVIIFILEIRSRVLEFKSQVKKKDIQSMVLFLLITFVVLPVLPNETVDPYDLFNPYITWMMVVLISGLSFVAYIAARIVGTSRGMMVAGFLGGFFSSTATTITFSKKVDREGKLTKQLTATIALACTTMYIRVVIVTSFISIDLTMQLAPAYLLGALSGYLYIYYLYRQTQKSSMDVDFMFKNPLEMKEALKFGLLFGVVFGATSLLHDWAGNLGIYISSLVSGLTDVDAITLSLSKLYSNEEVILTTAAIGIVIATFSNSFTKLAISYTVGNRMLGNQLAIAFAFPLMMIVAVLTLQNLLF